MKYGKIIIGAHQLSWGTNLEGVSPRVRKAEKLGCDAFEFFLSGNFGPASIVKEVTEKVGLIPIGCAVIRDNIDGDPLSTDETARSKAENAIEQYISWTRDMGGSLLVGPLANVLCKKNALYPTMEELQAGIQTFRYVARVASSNGVKVAIEPLQWSEMPWPNTVQQVLDFIKLVEEPNDVPKNVLGVLFDIYHALRMEENWFTALRTALREERLFHIHVAGPNRTPPRLNQHIAWSTIIEILKPAGWSGTITIESFGKECDLPFVVVGPGERLPAEEVIATGVLTLRSAGL